MCKPSAEIFGTLRRLNNQNELIRQDSGDGGFWWVNPSSTPAPHKTFLQPRDDLNGMFGYESSPQVEFSRFSASNGQSGLQEASRPIQVLGGMLCGRENPFHPALSNNVASAENKLLEGWATLYSANSLS